MIFVTVGTQLPFPRMIEAVVAWATQHGRTDLFIQHAGYAASLEGLPNSEFLDAATSARLMNEADIVVAHAGTGTILACLQNGTPCIIVPRKASLGEHRNDHQFATARRFEGRKGVFVVWDIADLPGILDRADALDGSDGINPFAEERLLQAIRDFIDERD